jgi:hypothetical protein
MRWSCKLCGVSLLLVGLVIGCGTPPPKSDAPKGTKAVEDKVRKGRNLDDGPPPRPPPP